MNLEWPVTISHRVDQMIHEHSASVALKDGYGHVLSYQAMGERVENIARALRAAKIPKGATIGVFQAPSTDWICSLLAILRVGAVYMPLDLRNSIPRLKSITTAAQPATILTDDQMASQIREIATQDVLSINVSQLEAFATSVESNVANSDSPAVILFTSGSTGEPKGIVMSHASLRAHFEGFHRAFDIASMAQVVLQQSTYSFDYSLNQIFAALAGGGCLYVAPAKIRGDPHELAKAMIEQGVTYTAATPSEYDMWFRFAMNDLRHSKEWKAAWFGGEATSKSVISGFRSLGLPELRTFSGYGPAEMTVSSTKAEVFYQDENLEFPLPGGLMLPNYCAYIVDEKLEPVPVGVSGEIVLGGVGVASGYLNQANLTEEKFVSDPFAKQHQHYVVNGWDRMYRSGDRGRLREDGAIYCDGRIDGDTQVKLRGFRIELSEIETVIIKAAGGALIHAAVTLHNDFLVAHVVFDLGTPQAGREAVLDKLRYHLPLPPYMCPSFFVTLDEMPLTSHLKIDRRAIQAMPLPDGVQVSTRDAKRELTPTEEALATLWTNVIPQRPSGLAVSSDFFHVGGNSLLLVKLQSEIKHAFSIAPRLIDLMNSSTLEAMALLVSDGASRGPIDWDVEVAIDDALLKTAQVVSASASRRSTNLRILVTGATGNLARFILPRLIQDERIEQINCLVRSSTSKLTTNNDLFTSSPKLSMIEGDLSLSDLGLSSSAFTSLAQNTDAILHCAANRNFWDGYEVLRSVNVNGVRTLARLALLNCSMLHVLSSGAVTLYGEEEGSISPNPPTDGSDGYVASKWAAEQYLDTAARELGLDVTVHRPEATQVSSSSGSVEAVSQELITLSQAMHARPDFGRVEGTVDMAPVEEVAGRIVAEVCDEKTRKDKQRGDRGPGKTDVRVVHHPGRLHATTGDLVRHAAQMDGAEEFATLPGMPVLKWFGEAKRAGFGQLVTAQELVVSEGDTRVVSRR